MTKNATGAGSQSQRRAEAQAAPAGKACVRARATLLVGEMRGFCHLARRVDAEVAVRLLQDFYVAAADIAVAHRATIDRVVGDTFVLLFPAQGGGRRDDGARAVRCGLALQRAFLALRNRWEREGVLRGGQLGLVLGIGSGQIVLAELQGVPGVHSVPFGEPLSRATRLCQNGRPADVLLDDETFIGARRLLERDVVFTSREISARGGRDALTAYKAQLRKAGLRVVSRREATDPVCGRELAPRVSRERREYGGAVFHFCSAHCAERFADDPSSWLR
jgi:class 3 adenylate cyclase/YHS domain-containing protein